MAERLIDDRERCLGYATNCLQLPKLATDRESRAVLKEMAAEWLKLADAPVDRANASRRCPATTPGAPPVSLGFAGCHVPANPGHRTER